MQFYLQSIYSYTVTGRQKHQILSPRPIIVTAVVDRYGRSVGAQSF